MSKLIMIFPVALMLACDNGNLEKVKELVTKEQIDPNVPDELGNTLLHFAAESGQLEVVKWLVNECKVDCDPQNTAGATPFRRACLAGHVHVAQWLVDECKVEHQQSDMDLAAENQFLNVSELPI